MEVKSNVWQDDKAAKRYFRLFLGLFGQTKQNVPNSAAIGMERS